MYQVRAKGRRMHQAAAFSVLLSVFLLLCGIIARAEDVDIDDTILEDTEVGIGGIGGNNSNDTDVFVADIVGGNPAGSSEYPFYAIPDRAGGLCGSVLIAPDFLLTAAHCGGAFQGNRIYIGANSLGGSDADETIRAGQEIRHPQFRSNRDPFRMENDIMLVQLQTPASSSQPLATLNTNALLPVSGSTVKAIGFGRKENNQISSILLEADLPAVGTSSCQQYYPSGLVDGTQMVCAGGTLQGETRRTCAGDSGGPLLTSGNVVVGLASFGRRDSDDTCNLATPSVFTRVSRYEDWIRETVCARTNTPNAATALELCNDTSNEGGGDDGGAGTFLELILDLVQLIVNTVLALFSFG